jgi:hypothetical protein
MRVKLVLALLIALAAGAQAGDKASCVKAIDRAKKAVSDLGRSGFAAVHAEVGLIAKGKKSSFSRELDAGSYCLFAVGDEATKATLEIAAVDASGKQLKKGQGVVEAFIPSFSVEAKGNVKLEIEADFEKNGTSSYIFVLLQKAEGAANPSDIVFERLGDRAKAVEDSGHEVVWAELDTLGGSPWKVTHKLAAGTYAIEVVSDDQNVKDLEVDFTDGSGKSVAKKEKSKEPKDGHMASLKGDAKDGDAKVTVSAVFQDGCKDSYAGVLIAKK